MSNEPGMLLLASAHEYTYRARAYSVAGERTRNDEGRLVALGGRDSAPAGASGCGRDEGGGGRRGGGRGQGGGGGYGSGAGGPAAGGAVGALQKTAGGAGGGAREPRGCRAPHC
eukprot:902803-Prorocentrum_minimum.AAC.1